MLFRTPLAWKNLTSSLSKLFLAATGVGFAVVLMFMQLGFRGALIDSNIQIFELFNPEVANLAIMSQARYNVSTEQRFPSPILDEALAMPEISDACSVSIERGTSKVRVLGHATRPIRVIGIELGNSTFFREPDLYSRLSKADQQAAGLLDRKSKSSYGFAETSSDLQEQRIELNNLALGLDGFFTLGTDFSSDGTILLSQRMHGKFFPWRSPTRNPSDVVDIALLHAEIDRSDPQYHQKLEALAERIEAISPTAIDVRPTSQFQVREKSFWANETPIGKIFMIGTVMGLVIGAIICYQIQFTDITDNLPEFATLKAMGYGSGYFWSIILSQSFYLACVGFAPGLLVSLGLYALLAETSGLVMLMSWERALLVWALTVAMCFVSGGLAIRKLFNSDPASLF